MFIFIRTGTYVFAVNDMDNMEGLQKQNVIRHVLQMEAKYVEAYGEIVFIQVGFCKMQL